jgi:uncharacterized protein YhaN
MTDKTKTVEEIADGTGRQEPIVLSDVQVVLVKSLARAEAELDEHRRKAEYVEGSTRWLKEAEKKIFDFFTGDECSEYFSHTTNNSGNCYDPHLDDLIDALKDLRRQVDKVDLLRDEVTLLKKKLSASEENLAAVEMELESFRREKIAAAEAAAKADGAHDQFDIE